MLIIFYLQFFGLWIKHMQAQTVTGDSRCYLEGGGSAESFLASEDVAMGTIIGKLRINGDPAVDNGDINLSLRERDSPVAISPGSKDLVLIKQLDKEGKHGPSSVYVNVICARRHSTDPTFVIPVNIRVTDINDNAPEWIGAPYLISLSEVTVPGTRILQGARAIDADQEGPFSTVEYQIVPGPYSDYVSFVSPLEGTIVLKKPLDYETLKNFTIKLRALDQGSPSKLSDTSLRVVITDADDQNPKFLRESYFGELPLDGSLGDVKISPEPIKALDQDEGLRAALQYSITPSAESKYFQINPKTAVINLVIPLGPADLAHAVTLVIRATQLDNADRYALTTLIISRRGSKQVDATLNFVQRKFQTKIREDLGVGSRILALPTNRPGKYHKYTITDPKESQYFSIGHLGEVVLQKSLDYEKSTQHIFSVVATDGIGNATADVIIDVLDVNDWEPRFRQSHYEFHIPQAQHLDEPIALGKLEAADGDRNDKVTLNINGPHANLFTVDSRGVVWLKGDRPNATVTHLIATALDTGVPQKSSTVPITITMDDVLLAQPRWGPGILSAFSIILSLFIIVIFIMAIYIYKNKKPKSRNRVHSHAHSTTSAANLVTRDKSFGGLHLAGGNMSLGNPINTHGGSGSSISAGASTIIAASLEREAQREREKENYTATVRSIISRATAAREGRFYDEDIERDSIENTEPNRNWNSANNNNNLNNSNNNNNNLSNSNGNLTLSARNKKLSWCNGEEPTISKTEVAGSTDTLGSTENNLTVYF